MRKGKEVKGIEAERLGYKGSEVMEGIGRRRRWGPKEERVW